MAAREILWSVAGFTALCVVRFGVPLVLMWLFRVVHAWVCGAPQTVAAVASELLPLGPVEFPPRVRAEAEAARAEAAFSEAVPG